MKQMSAKLTAAERQLDPLLRSKKDAAEVLEKKEKELNEKEERINKLKTDHIEQIKNLNASRVASDQVKKIVIERDNVSYF